MASETIPTSSHPHPVNTDPIRISNGSFEWAKMEDAPSPTPATDENAEKTKAFIHDINMSIKKGSLTAIVGPVGCGKSSLFAAILGEMNCVAGEVNNISPTTVPIFNLISGYFQWLCRLLPSATVDPVLHNPRKYHIRQTHGYSAS